MSFPQDADDMEGPMTAGSIRRARERALAGGPREDFATFAKRMAQPPQSQQEPQYQQLPSQTSQRIPIPSSARRDLTGVNVTAPSTPPSYPGPSRIPVPNSQGASNAPLKDTPSGMTISRPAPAPQWPLSTPLASQNQNTNASRGGPSMAGEPYRPPPGRSLPPQRPPRPSHVPSILDSSKVQDQMTTVFAYNMFNQAGATGGSGAAALQPPANIKSARESDTSLAHQSSASSTSRPSTISSVGSIPDFPIPVTVPVAIPVAIPVPPPVVAMPPPRRSVNLGPPPSARRGASSFYSNASYVSPIPEESPRSRSRGSFASSAAMPDNWDPSTSAVLTPNYADTTSVYENIPEIREASSGDRLDDDYHSPSGSDDGRETDEKNLVRSASVGKRGKAALVTTGPFRDGTGYVEASSTSSATTAPTNKATFGPFLTADSILDAYNAATAVDPSNPNRMSSISQQTSLGNSSYGNMEFGSSRPYSRLSAIRRPPRLDMEAVRKAEARGSLTSLPDLIRRATRLAASLERGRRPASRLEGLDVSPGMYGRDAVKSADGDIEKYRSGLSDMLAAFPPPANPPQTRRSFRQSLREQVGSWPLPLNRNNFGNGRFSGQRNLSDRDDDEETSSELTDLKNQQPSRKGRRCCGLPLWGFVLAVIAILIIVAAAIVIPLEFFVIRKENSVSNLAKCQSQLTCANGGTNIVSKQGFCSCICTNDFTGFDCTIAGSNGCTTTTLAASSTNGNLANVTLGNALPRLIEQAQQNFSISLSGAQILAVFNSGNLSCAAENALVTFDGETVRSSSGSTVVNAVVEEAVASNSNDDASGLRGISVVTVTVEAESATTVFLKVKRDNGFVTISTGTPTATAAAFQTVTATTLTFSTQITPSIISPTSTTTVTTTVTPTTTVNLGSTGTTSAATPSSTFTVTEDVLDFARVAVLLILQEESLSNAETAQSTLQRFFTTASTGTQEDEAGVTIQEAQNLTLSNGNSINLVDFQVNVANTLQGIGIAA